MKLHLFFSCPNKYSTITLQLVRGQKRSHWGSPDSSKPYQTKRGRIPLHKVETPQLQYNLRKEQRLSRTCASWIVSEHYDDVYYQCFSHYYLKNWSNAPSNQERLINKLFIQGQDGAYSWCLIPKAQKSHALQDKIVRTLRAPVTLPLGLLLPSPWPRTPLQPSPCPCHAMGCWSSALHSPGLHSHRPHCVGDPQ